MDDRFVDLPRECWELIFSHLHHHHQQFLEPISLVCKRFLSLSNPLLHSLNISLHTIPFLPRLLFRFHCIKTIDAAEFCGDLNALLSQIARSHLDLQSLHLSNQDSVPLEGLRELGSKMKSLKSLKCSNIQFLCNRDLIEISNSLPWLQELDISYPSYKQTGASGGPVTDDGIEEMSRKLRELQKIDLSGNCFISDKSLVALSSNCVFLREIVAHDCCFVTENGLGFVMSHSATLASVSLNGLVLRSSILSPSLHAIENSFICARALCAVEFSNMLISDALLCSLAKAHLPLKRFALSYCQSYTLLGISSILYAYQFLSELDLRGAHFLTDQCMSDLSDYLSSVISINLTACRKLTNSTFFILTKSCPSLMEIKMEGTSLGEEKFVVDLVKGPRIMSLKLAWNSRLTDDSLRKFALVCPNLQQVDLSYCIGITGVGIAETLRSCCEVRNLEINWCGGVKSLGMDLELTKLQVLLAASSGISDKGLLMIGKTCPWLLHLDVAGCLGVSATGLEEIVRSCRGLREINIKGCFDVNVNFVTWMVFSRPSLRKMISTCGFAPSDNQKNFFLRHGCLICNDCS